MHAPEPAAPATSAVAVGRQPIVDRDGEVVGYELLYRSTTPGSPLPSGEQMTAEVVLGALTIGVSQLVGDKVIFCNAERGVLTGETPVTLPAQRTVIEVLETVRCAGRVTGVSPVSTPRSALQKITLSPTSWLTPMVRAPSTTSAVICSPEGSGAPGVVER